MHFVSFKSLFCLRYGQFKFGRDIYCHVASKIQKKQHIGSTVEERIFASRVRFLFDRLDKSLQFLRIISCNKIFLPFDQNQGKYGLHCKDFDRAVKTCQLFGLI